MDKAVQVDLLQAKQEEMPSDHYEEVTRISEWIKEKTHHRPIIGIICGSGLGGLAEIIDDKEVFPYKDIPGFPVSTAPGHRGRLIFGRLSGKEVLCMQGRLHPYEGYPLWKCAMPVRVMKMMGVKILIVTNAAGSLNHEYKIGDLMIIKDHINIPGLSGIHPLRGQNDERFGQRFIPLNRVYDLELRKVARRVAAEVDILPIVKEGSYAMQGGPTFETVGEAKAMRLLGADVAGMSTVHEVIAASHCGMRVFGLSLVTNYIVTDEDDEYQVDSGHVIDIAQSRATIIQNLIGAFIREL